LAISPNIGAIPHPKQNYKCVKLYTYGLDRQLLPLNQSTSGFQQSRLISRLRVVEHFDFKTV